MEGERERETVKRGWMDEWMDGWRFNKQSPPRQAVCPEWGEEALDGVPKGKSGREDSD
jgi:hypothetical protein